jgi:hypothetical protein
MDFISGLALILLTLVGYSSGTVLAGKNKRVNPGLLDLIIVIALWTAALATRPALGKILAILVWLVIGLSVSAILTGLRRGSFPDREQQILAPQGGVAGLRRLWGRWKAFAGEMGNFQGRTILAFFYFFIITPFGIAVRLFGDPLRTRRGGVRSFWIEQQPVSPTLQKAREQF